MNDEKFTAILASNFNTKIQERKTKQIFSHDN